MWPSARHSTFGRGCMRRRSFAQVLALALGRHASASCCCKMTYSFSPVPSIDPEMPSQASRWLRFACTEVAGTWGPQCQRFVWSLGVSLSCPQINKSQSLHSFGFHLPPSNNLRCFGAPNSDIQCLRVSEACFPTYTPLHGRTKCTVHLKAKI